RSCRVGSNLSLYNSAQIPLRGEAAASTYTLTGIPGKKECRLFQGLYIGLLDHFQPLGDLCFDIGIELFGTTAAVGHAEFGKALLGVLTDESLPRRTVEFRQDVVRRS